MIEKRIAVQFKRTWDWLWNLNERLKIKDLNHKIWITHKEVEDCKKLLEDYRIQLEVKQEEVKMLRLIITQTLKPNPIGYYRCLYCEFEGKEYRDFCPGCSKDNTGKTCGDYFKLSTVSPKADSSSSSQEQ